MTKNFFIETFGCQMNKGDSDLMRLSLEKKGYTETDSEEDADICLFNTCSVRQHAEDRALSRIESTKKSSSGKNKIIVITGCVAQRIGDKVIDDGIADIAIGPYQSPMAGDIIENYIEQGGKDANLFISQNKSDFGERLNTGLIESREENPWHKWVTITHGCENFCTYCIVPYVRGKLISFPSQRIISFIRELAKEGIKEITLLGQNVNQYGMDSGDIPFHELLGKTAEIKGLSKINFLTSHPMDFSREIINIMKNYPNISRGIHLPLQSGSNSVLKRMNRKYTLEDYLEIVEHMDSALEDYAISTDLIVGFPGETEGEYEETLDAVKKIKFDEAFMYAYSPREGTPSFNLEETLSRDEKIGRLNRLITVQREISLAKLKKQVNKSVKAIAEKISKKSDQEVSGKTEFNHPVVFKGNLEDIGNIFKVKFTEVRGSTLFGEKIDKDD